MFKSGGDGLTIHFTKKTGGGGGHGLTVNATKLYSGDGLTVLSTRLSVQVVNSTNRIEPVFLAPFRLYCKLVRRPGQGCSSAPWAPCRMQHSYRSFTVHHGVWFCLAGFHSSAAATGSLLGGRSSAGGTMSLFLSPSGNRFYDFLTH